MLGGIVRCGPNATMTTACFGYKQHETLNEGFTHDLVLVGLSNADTLPQEVSSQGPLEVWTLSYPVHGLAQRIGGEEINLRVSLPRGQDAADGGRHPLRLPNLLKQIWSLQMVLTEGWIKTASLPTGLVVSAAQGFFSHCA